MTQVNGREMESKDAPHVSHGVRGRSRLVKVIFYFISFLVFVQNTKYILSKEYQRSHSWVLECKLNSYWSKLRLREKMTYCCFLSSHALWFQKSFWRKDRIPFSFLGCWDIPSSAVYLGSFLFPFFVPLFIIDFEIFIHFLYDKLRGLPRRVFTLFWSPNREC